MKESSVEDHLRKLVEEVGGLVEKFTIPGRRGPPDDLVTWPWGEMDLVECKRPKGGRRSELQKRDHRERAKRSVPVYLLHTIPNVDDYVLSRRLRRHRPALFSVPLG